MPVGQKFDFLLNNNGYILARPGNGLARAWQRSGVPDTPTVEQPRLAGEYGGLPSPLEYPEVWNDWSGGYGHAYRHPADENSYFGFLANPNTYHWSENFDARFSRQLIHCQKLISVALTVTVTPVNNFLDVPSPNASDTNTAGAGGVLIIGPGFSTTAVMSDRQTVMNDNISLASLDSGYQAAIFGSFIYIPVLSATGFAQQTFAGVRSAPQVLPARGFVNAGNRLWRWHGNENHNYLMQSVAAGADPTVTSNWSFTLNVGNSWSDIKSAISVEDQLFLGLQNGLFAGDNTGTFMNVLPEIANQMHNDNCRDICVYNGGVVVPAISGLYWYNVSTGESFNNTMTGPSNKSPIRGWARAVTPFGQWIFAGVWTGSESWILSGAPSKTTQNVNQIDVWHPLWKLPNVTKVSRLHFDGITVTSGNTSNIPSRLWIGTDATIEIQGTIGLYIVPVPINMDNPLSAEGVFAGSANYANSARMDLGNTDGRAPSTFKVYRSCEVWADNLDGSQRWGLIYYTIDQGVRTLLGTVNTSPKATLFFPSNQGSFVMGQSIELSLESYILAGAEATSPSYRSIVLRQTLSPRSVDVITAIVDVGDNMVDRQGSAMRPGANQLAELRGLVATGPAILTDLTGATWFAKVLAPVQEQEQWQEGATNPSVLATVKMSIMSFTGN